MSTQRSHDFNQRIKKDLFKLTAHICIIAFIYLFAFFLLLNIYFENLPKKTVANKKVHRKIFKYNNNKLRHGDYSIIDHELNYEDESFFENDACFNLNRCLNTENLYESDTRTKLKIFVYPVHRKAKVLSY